MRARPEVGDPMSGNTAMTKAGMQRPGNGRRGARRAVGASVCAAMGLILYAVQGLPELVYGRVNGAEPGSSYWGNPWWMAGAVAAAVLVFLGSERFPGRKATVGRSLIVGLVAAITYLLFGAAGAAIAASPGNATTAVGFIVALSMGVYYNFWMALILALVSLAVLRRA